jgi:hypothetical protein
MPGDGDDAEVTLALARAIVAEASPAELEVFDLLAEGYREDLRSSRRGDGALGFGADVVTAAVAAVPVASAVVALLQAAAQDALKEGGVAAAKALVRRWSHAGREPDARTAVPADVVARARDAAVAQAQLLGLTPERSALLGNAVAGVLASP